MSAHVEESGRYKRRESDSIFGQVKSLWPILMFCCIGYAAWEVQRSKLSGTSDLASKTAEDVGLLKQTVAVQTAMLQRIEESVKEIARNQRRHRED